ncbi:MAG TPA: hypothetical protein VFY93_06030 [Planctomycetota bacterium]|nr:hypothetical protein [Planctomycetota bacterium]
MVRGGRFGLLFALAAAACGCSSFFAALGPPTDLTVLRQGASREEIECELGRPRSERLLENGVAATYRVRVGQRRSPIENAATCVGRAAQAVDTAGTTRFDTFFGILAAVPTLIVTDVVLSTREISRIAGGRREVTVYYDDAGSVVRFTDPVKR